MTTAEDPGCRREVGVKGDVRGGVRSGVRGEGMRSLDGGEDLLSANKEWDRCVRRGTLTVGAGMAAGMFIGAMMGIGLPLVWGTGAGILWSVKRCRTILRDGIMTPEQARAKREQKAKERIEKKRELDEAKKIKQTPSAPGPKKHKGGRALDVPEGTHECCKKIQEILEKQKQKECDMLKKIEEELGKCGIKDSSLKDHFEVGVCPRNKAEKPIDSSEKPSVGKSKLNFKSTTTVKLFVPQSPAFRTRVSANGADVCLCRVGKDGKMDTCPGCASLLSSRQELEPPIQLTMDDENKKDIDDDDDDHHHHDGIFPGPQEAADEDQNDDSAENNIENYEIQPEDVRISKNPSDLLVLQEVSTMNDGLDVQEDEEYEYQQNTSLFLDANQSSLDEDIMEEEVIEIDGDRLEVIIQEVDDDTEDNDEDDYDSAEPEAKLPEVGGDFTQQLNNQDEEYIEEEFGKEEVIFVETYKSESWPFSFSLPSLDKFHKKASDSTFKWPPLPSSIIVKPRKEPTCTCPGENMQGERHKQENENLQPEPLKFEACTCGQSENQCTCNVQGHT